MRRKTRIFCLAKPVMISELCSGRHDDMNIGMGDAKCRGNCCGYDEAEIARMTDLAIQDMCENVSVSVADSGERPDFYSKNRK